MANPRTPQKFGDLEPSAWPGERLGLPNEGQFSIGRVGRRVGAIIIDWVAALMITMLIPVSGSAEGFVTGAIFAVMQIIFIPTIGGSVGHRAMGMRVIKLGGGWVGVWRPAVRTLLLMLILPVIVWDSDQRGFHDKIAGTVLVRA
ncbi:RDD family protein [Leucobacter sp. UCMA 4100]|uniref:RDD family protein n=1 Tax=Leucobacter TaxID=55968 RepID=UPI001C2363B5|nr:MULTISPECIES: RDD family protein [Leucobacter]MDA3148211.1 RDD family protein [Leucobacter sp. UCMA 4100]